MIDVPVAVILPAHAGLELKFNPLAKAVDRVADEPFPLTTSLGPDERIVNSSSHSCVQAIACRLWVGCAATALRFAPSVVRSPILSTALVDAISVRLAPILVALAYLPCVLLVIPLLVLASPFWVRLLPCCAVLGDAWAAPAIEAVLREFVRVEIGRRLLDPTSAT